MEIKLTFDSSAKRDILQFFDKQINEDGIVIESFSKQKVMGIDGSEICEDEFAGIKKGSQIFLKNDLISMFKLSEQ